MNFQDAIKTCFSKYAEFKGTASLSEYWWFSLFIVLASVATTMVSPVLSGLFSLGVLLPSLAAATRRLHDTDRSGWWQLIVFLPVVGWIILIVFLAQGSKATSKY
ncbi:DUF805 domain-containing protein [Rhodoferax lacus]|uniref:DUF805 domain-containing protein n=1 Tax=Rhodoferax lacus TaxID=2184758 RepID=A0A3E1R5Z8_9BURK|nr:DUF805 domain-containing protein [Rhodoferax lacus]RFO94799.1 DUF805 domain-containing protein [Rhodoferax lacus]